MAFSDWTEKKKLVFSIAIGAAFVLIAWGVFFWRMSLLNGRVEVLNQKQTELADIEKQVQAGNINQLTSELDQLRKLFDDVKDSIPLEREVVNFLTEDLRRLIEEKTNLGRYDVVIKEGDVSTVNVPGPAGAEPFKKQVFNLQVTGTLDDALSFLNIIEERMPTIINVDKFSMAVAPQRGAETTLLKMSFDFFIYFKDDEFVTDDAGKPAAAKPAAKPR